MLQDTKSHSLAGFLASDFSRVSSALAQEICKTRQALAERAGRATSTARTPRRSTRRSRRPRSWRRRRTASRPSARRRSSTASTSRSRASSTPRSPGRRRCTAATRSSSRRASPSGRGRTRRPPTAEAPAAPLAEGEEQEDDSELARVIRYANRVPLLYQQSACATFKAVLETAWRNYGITQSRGALPAGPMVIFVHMASVWVPFTSESKEAIADYDEIRKEIKLALQECGRRLGVFLRRRERAKSEFRRRNIFELYIEEVVEACARLKGGKLAEGEAQGPAPEDRREADRRRADRRDPGPATAAPRACRTRSSSRPRARRARRRSCRAGRHRVTPDAGAEPVTSDGTGTASGATAAPPAAEGADQDAARRRRSAPAKADAGPAPRPKRKKR